MFANPIGHQTRIKKHISVLSKLVIPSPIHWELLLITVFSDIGSMSKIIGGDELRRVISSTIYNRSHDHVRSDRLVQDLLSRVHQQYMNY